LLLLLSCRGIGWQIRLLRCGGAGCLLLGGHTARQPTAGLDRHWICAAA